MPSNGRRRVRIWLKAVLGLFLGLYLSVPAFGFTPVTAPLLTAASVTPNLMLLVDNSGSMDSIIMDSGFDPTLNWPAVYSVTYSCSYTRFGVAYNCGYYAGNVIGNGADYSFLSALSTSYCSGGQYAFYKNIASVTCLTLPDPRGSGLTRYPVDYLSYLVSKTNAGTPITVTNSTRILTAISVATSLVTTNRKLLRIGLATFNPPTRTDSGPGGNITQAISDLNAVTAYNPSGQSPALVPAVSQTTADQNFTKLKNAIASLTASANTPLAETYYEITRYMRGMTPYYNTTPSTYTSPIQYRCQKNFGVVITDGLPTYDRTFPDSDPAFTDGGPRLPNWDQVNNDGNNLYGDSEGDTLYLDDLAKFAYDIDMRDSKVNGTDATGKSWASVDFPKQNMFTYAIGFTASNQMLLDTASYGHGKYYLATDNASLTTALTSAFSDITSKAGSGGTGTTSSNTLSSTSTYYQTLYDPADWRGIIKAFPISSTGTVSSTATWNTNTTMAVGATAPTFESYNTAKATPITMTYANYSPAQQTSLASTAAAAQNLVTWSQGTNVSGLRTRTVLLGDVVNSPLVLASNTAQTAADLTNDSTYTAYLATKSLGMTSSLVVNANDGYTNVINAASGLRSYAYMPSTALASLSQVADTGYVNGTSHVFLNDGPIGVYDAQIKSGWKTLALSGTGAGGKAYSAIQLYDASLGNVVKALWEIRPDTTLTTTTTTVTTPFADLGYAYATPQVARLPDGTWAAFIANGYGSTKGVASLLVVSLTDGSLIKEIVAESSNGSNGLSTVALKVNASDTVVAAYGGDLLGHMWKFDLSNASPSSWGVAFAGNPLFTAPGGANQPITAAPLLVTNATSGKMVYFGTGKLNETSDKTTTAAQGFYAVWDADTNTTGNYTVSNLQAQAVTGITTSGTAQYLTTTSNTTDYTSLKGFYLPLVYGTSLTGHRVIYQATYKSGRIIFTTAYLDTSDSCASQGSGYTVELNALSGSLLTYPVIDTNGDGVVDTKDTIVAGIYISTGIPNLNGIIDVAATSTAAASQRKIINDSSGTITTLVEAGGSVTTAGRIMWRQIQ